MSMIIPILIFMLLLIIFKISLGWWVYQNAKIKNNHPFLWGWVTFLIPYFIGLLLYFVIGRSQQRQMCPQCKKLTTANKPYCSNCGQELPKYFSANPSSRNRKPLLIAFFTIITMIGVSLSCIFYYGQKPSAIANSNVAIGQVQNNTTKKMGYFFLVS